jgi:hypothetical protein
MEIIKILKLFNALQFLWVTINAWNKKNVIILVRAKKWIKEPIKQFAALIKLAALLGIKDLFVKLVIMEWDTFYREKSVKNVALWGTLLPCLFY